MLEINNQDDIFKNPSDIYTFWLTSLDIISLMNDPDNFNRLRNDFFVGLTPRELIEKLENELNLEVVLSMLATIEAIFRLELIYYVKIKPKEKITRQIRLEFKQFIDGRNVQEDKIRLEDILKVFREIHPEIAKALSKLKEYFQYRHWLAHGRYGKIQYWTIPDPVDIYMLFETISENICFRSL